MCMRLRWMRVCLCGRGAIGMNPLSSVIHRVKDHILPDGGTIPLPQAGLYHFEWRSGAERSRIHLRVNQDGSGHLLVNASRVMHLNPTAVYMAWLYLEEMDPGIAVRSLQKAYRVSAAQAREDYSSISESLEQLVRPDGACPIHDLNLEVTAPFSARPSAPYRMDLALTYRCNNDCSHCYNGRPRSYPELDTEDWKQILDRLWDEGIPHIVFTGGEPTLRDDLAELVAHAERNGQITGINTNGRRMQDPNYLRALLEAGLDHVQITLESHDPEIHDQMVSRKGAWGQTVAGLRNALKTSLYVMTNTTMLQNNYASIGETLDFLVAEGVPTVGLNALIYSGRGNSVGTGLPENELEPILITAREKTATANQRLIWYTPTQYCHFDPMNLELGVKGCTAALYNMCIEPNGSVIPCQSYYRSVGNIVDDPWMAIWNHPICLDLRERTSVPTKCTTCALLSECGGGCPLMWEH